MLFPNYPIINTHCHILNFAFVPNKMFKILSRIDENIVTKGSIQDIAEAIVKVIPGVKFDHIAEVLRIYSDNNIKKAAEWYVKQMKEAGIIIATPLMMDLESCFEANAIKPDENYIPYYCYSKDESQPSQINQISKIAAKYPWQIFPFIMFDPRRKSAVEICKFALENQGFLGIKLYPPLGYFPVPTVRQSDKINNALEEMYDYCGKERIPITVHCSTAGAYAQVNPDWEDIWEKTAPFQWLETIRKYELKVNFAHFGGKYIKHPLDQKTKKSLEWHLNIQTIMGSAYRMNIIGDKESVFADISYHSLAHNRKLQDEYFQDLKELLSNKYSQTQVIFGSDASMISHTWSEIEVLQPFLSYLNENEQERLFYQNPAKFLFENGEIPSRYINFIKKKIAKSLEENSLPDWIIKQGDKFQLKKLAHSNSALN